MSNDLLSSLKNKHTGESCLIFACGPSLRDFFSDNSQNDIESFMKKNTVFSIKQSYLQLRGCSDYHFFNCNNFMPYKKNNNIFVAQDDGIRKDMLSNFWGNQEYDILVNLNPATNFLVDSSNIDEYMFDTNPRRPRGPGIMYETVLYFAVHLGFKSIQTVGWDYMPPNVENVTGHFYPEKLRKKLKNPAALRS